MGIYDREYYQDDNRRQGFTFGGQRAAVTNLMLVTVAIVLIDLFTPVTPDGKGRWLSNFMALEADVYRHPWDIWQLLSYGFAHTSLGMRGGIWHVGMNMFLLWMFGRVIESRLGRGEFLLFYFLAIIFSGLVWLICVNAWGLGGGHAVSHYQVIGASGAVTAVFMLFVLYYPKQMVSIWGLIPVYAWVIGALLIGSDLLRAIGASGDDSVAWQAHLAGAGFAFLYLRFRWNFSRLLPAKGKWKLKWPSGGPKLRLHHPDVDYSDLDDEADQVLAKVHREGEENLTAWERRVLEKYSRRLREKRR